MSQRKVVGRRTAIGLGIVCIVLVAGLAGSVTYYMMVVRDKEATYSNYASTHSHRDSDYEALANYKNQLETWLAGNATQLRNQVDLLSDIVSLVQWNYIFGGDEVSQTAGSYSAWFFYANYFGYVVVDVESSTTDTTYVQVIYSSHGVNYDQIIPVGRGGTVSFRILPSTDVEVRVGNNNAFHSATIAFTIKYYYNTNQTVLIKP